LRYFQNIYLYHYYYLLTFLIHTYLTQTAQFSKLSDAAIDKNFNPVGRAQQRHRRQTQTDGSCHKANVT